MMKHWSRKGSNNYWKTEKNEVIEWGNVENITKLRTPREEKGFWSLLPSDECKLKQVWKKQSLLIRAQIFEKAGI